MHFLRGPLCLCEVLVIALVFQFVVTVGAAHCQIR